jgi:hypothetical protein
VRPAVLLALLALIGAVLLRRWLIQTPRSVVMQYLRRTSIALAIGIFLFLIAAGRLPWMVALLGAWLRGFHGYCPYSALFLCFSGYGPTIAPMLVLVLAPEALPPAVPRSNRGLCA